MSEPPQRCEQITYLKDGKLHTLNRCDMTEDDWNRAVAHVMSMDVVVWCGPLEETNSVGHHRR